MSVFPRGATAALRTIREHVQHQIRSAAFSMSKRSPRDLLRVTVAGAV